MYRNISGFVTRDLGFCSGGSLCVGKMCQDDGNRTLRQILSEIYRGEGDEYRVSKLFLPCIQSLVSTG